MKRRALVSGLLIAGAARAAAQAAAPMSLVDAAARGNLAQVQRLLDAGAPIEGRDGNGRTPVRAATAGNHVEVARALIARGADVNAQDRQRDSAFLLAGAEGFTEIVRMTLGAGG